MKIKVVLLLTVLISVLGSDVVAYTLGDFLRDAVQPGRRRGLVARMDIGGGASFIGVDLASGDLNKTEGAIAMTAGFGYAPTDQFMLQVDMHWSVYASALDEESDIIWFIILGPFGPLLVDKQLILSVDAAYFFRPSIPSWFVEFGVGDGLINDPFDEHTLISTAHDGLGISTGVGYEFSRHFYMEVKYLYSKANEDYLSGPQDWSCSSVQFVIGVFGY